MAVVFMASNKRKKYTDVEVVEGISHHDRTMEEWFYNYARNYFNEHFNEVFFDKDLKQEIFQRTFLKLWTELGNGKIRVKDGEVQRQQTAGGYRTMSCSLTTFLMAFAKNENREIMRNCKEDNYAELFPTGNGDYADEYDDGEEIRTQQIRIVDDCIHELSPHCVEILTLFYYQEKSLDEILEIRKEKNTNKTGLKSAKSKCMATLREKAEAQFRDFGINFS